jgi:hypothetical protein
MKVVYIYQLCNSSNNNNNNKKKKKKKKKKKTTMVTQNKQNECKAEIIPKMKDCSHDRRSHDFNYSWSMYRRVYYRTVGLYTIERLYGVCKKAVSFSFETRFWNLLGGAEQNGVNQWSWSRTEIWNRALLNAKFWVASARWAGALSCKNKTPLVTFRMSKSSWLMDQTRSREMPSCSAIDLAKFRRSSKIPSYDIGK